VALDNKTPKGSDLMKIQKIINIAALIVTLFALSLVLLKNSEIAKLYAKPLEDSAKTTYSISCTQSSRASFPQNYYITTSYDGIGNIQTSIESNNNMERHQRPTEERLTRINNKEYITAIYKGPSFSHNTFCIPDAKTASLLASQKNGESKRPPIMIANGNRWRQDIAKVIPEDGSTTTAVSNIASNSKNSLIGSFEHNENNNPYLIAVNFEKNSKEQQNAYEVSLVSQID